MAGRTKTTQADEEDDARPALQNLGLASGTIAIAVYATTMLGEAGIEFPISEVCRKMSRISYALEDGRFGIGSDDGWLVLMLVLVLLGARSMLASWVWLPLASHVGALGKKMEIQGWQFSYYACTIPWGLQLYCDSPYFLNHAPILTDFPVLALAGAFKLYFLMQLAFWIQMLAVTWTEPWEKDFPQMMVHHVLAIGMCAISYAIGHVRGGHIIFVILDPADALLPLAKMLRYSGLETLCDGAFALFAVVWIITRHGLYLHYLYFLYTQGLDIMSERAGPRSAEVVSWFLVVLGLLQCLLLFWLYHLLVAVKAAICGGSASEMEITTDVVDDRADRHARKKRE